MVYLVLSELVMFSVCGGEKIGLTGEEEGDATEEIHLRGGNDTLYRLLRRSSMAMAPLRFSCERCNSLHIMVSKYIIRLEVKEASSRCRQGRSAGACVSLWCKLV